MKVLVVGSGGREHALAWQCACFKYIPLNFQTFIVIPIFQLPCCQTVSDYKQHHQQSQSMIKQITV